VKGYEEEVHGALRLYRKAISLKVRECSPWKYQWAWTCKRVGTKVTEDKRVVGSSPDRWHGMYKGPGKQVQILSPPPPLSYMVLVEFHWLRGPWFRFFFFKQWKSNLSVTCHTQVVSCKLHSACSRAAEVPTQPLTPTLAAPTPAAGQNPWNSGGCRAFL
jgi:hypothetical protein